MLRRAGSSGLTCYSQESPEDQHRKHNDEPKIKRSGCLFLCFCLHTLASAVAWLLFIYDLASPHTAGQARMNTHIRDAPAT
jgi:hypothetical protein